MSESNVRRIRVVIDTNLFVSSVITSRGAPYTLRARWQAHAFVLVVSVFQLDEIKDVLSRPKFKPIDIGSVEERARLVRRLSEEAEVVEPPVSLPLSVRDPKDERILGAALAAADFLVTGDKDLLVLAGDPLLGALRIVTAADFLAFLGEHDSGERA